MPTPLGKKSLPCVHVVIKTTTQGMSGIAAITLPQYFQARMISRLIEILRPLFEGGQ